MKYLLSVFLGFLCTAAFAQQAEPLIFRERTYSFGDLKEEQGPADHEFIFTNNSGRPVRIMKVLASCGCTTPDWTKEVIQPGKNGFVRARFDPHGRPGYFNKTLSVMTDLDANAIVLQITGQVTSARNPEPTMIAALGNLRMASKFLNVGKVYINREPVQKEFAIMNTGEKTVRFLSANTPSHLSIEYPPQLAPGEKGVLRLTYRGNQKNMYGYQVDNILLVTDDAGDEAKALPVYASLEEYYPKPTPEEQQRAPQLAFRDAMVDIGRYRYPVTLERSVFARNPGKSDLVIKSLQPNCSCLAATAVNTVVHPGDSAEIKLVFTPQKRVGTQVKAVTIYSNDPRSPVQMLQVQVFLEY